MRSYPPRVSLGSFPTRIQSLPRWSRETGVEIFVKRDDETGSDLSGNKVRKLEFLLAEAQAQRADLILTCGGVQSNHCRATAVAARRLGMDSLLFLRGEDPGDRDGNLLLDALVGANLRFITPEAYARRAQIMAEAAEEARARGRRPYVIPEGGSNGLGAFGYLALVDELVLQGLGQGPPVESTSPSGRPTESPGTNAASVPWDHIVCATGSGGTLAGLLAGTRRRNLPVKVWGFAVCDSAIYFQARVREILGELRDGLSEGRWPGLSEAFPPDALDPPADEIRVLEGYKGPGYALAFPELLALVRDVAARDGLFLDPVYTGKAFFGLLREIEKGTYRRGERVLFLHTGGIFSLYAWRRELLGSPESS